MRILWAANFTSQSGYSIQSRLFVPRLKRLGHEVAVFNLGIGAGSLPALVEGIKVLPPALDPLGSDIIHGHAAHFRADAVISLIDAWGLNPEIMRHMPWYPITPIDRQPVPERVTNALAACRAPIALTRWGERQLRVAGHESYYLPHGVDPAVWQPGDRRAARKALGLADDVFLVSFVGVNDSVPSRKGIPELLVAWQMFAQTYPDAMLYLHTSETGNLLTSVFGGVNIPAIIKTLGLDPQRVRIADQYRYRTGIPARELATLAQASDVLIAPSRGEGFGLPVLEFQRAGCPVITTDFGAQKELNFSGWLVEGDPEWSEQNAFWIGPSIASIVETLEAAYLERGDPERRRRAIEGARDYDIDYVIGKYAMPVLRVIAERALEGWRVA